ncbi:MAG: VCBS repeat-containing protein [Saprospiraceae bacterium]|nr:VCBS repeat-containing protein [Saprospiraceae bacterium]
MLDINKDNKLDLIHNGEWEPISILINTGSKFEDRTKEYGLTNTLGWWNKLEAGDLDNDESLDLIAETRSKFKV